MEKLELSEIIKIIEAEVKSTGKIQGVRLLRLLKGKYRPRILPERRIASVEMGEAIMIWFAIGANKGFINHS